MVQVQVDVTTTACNTYNYSIAALSDYVGFRELATHFNCYEIQSINDYVRCK